VVDGDQVEDLEGSQGGVEISAAAVPAGVGEMRTGQAWRALRAVRRPYRFFSERERHRIVAAIRKAESRTSGEIRVHVEGRCPGGPVIRARQLFAALGMHQTARRNGVLLYLAVRDRKFAVIGDEGIHQVVPERFWEKVASEMERHFRAGQFLPGISRVIDRIGAELSRHFPPTPDDRNELPDAPSEGRAS
jgi:uncharacterized membrane protein